MAQGNVARVNGDLAVSRGFGDAEYKKTGGPGPEDRPVTADPELGEFECDESDVLIIVCDGVSEGEFSNPEVVKLISESLAKDGDPGAAARATILHAEKKNSKDNITCMIVLFDGAKGEECTESKVFTPGPLRDVSKESIDSYEVMAKRAALTVEQAVEMRYDLILTEIGNDPERLAPESRRELEAELKNLTLERQGSIRGPEGEKGSDERRSWFEEWCKAKAEAGAGGGGGFPPMEILQMLQQQQRFAGLGGGFQEAPPDGRKVIAADAATLKTAVDAQEGLEWDERIAEVANTEGTIIKEDKSDSTMHVHFATAKMWLPISVLTVLESQDTQEGGDTAAAGTEGYVGTAPPAP